MKKTICLLTIFVFGISVVSSEIVTKTGVFSGIRVTYDVVLPKGFNPSRTYPAILAFAGGGQEMGVVEDQLQKHWVAEAERRGYLVFSPAAPDVGLFYENGDQVFPAFLDQLLRDYKIESSQFHVAGRSNGGLSAFHLASLFPRYFRSITAFPGFLLGATDSQIDGLKSIPIFMHAGSEDSFWRQMMQKQYEDFQKRGFKSVHFQVEAGLGHALDANLAGSGAKRLFDQLESSAKKPN